METFGNKCLLHKINSWTKHELFHLIVFVFCVSTNPGVLGSRDGQHRDERLAEVKLSVLEQVCERDRR